ncbi:hypothetical protein QBC34DRAFT_418077 [Podospora aff. communis PSN243]|uniref:SET domain-containing protein n=1 Tax=Podospora aff. communis PSN243 TaxID=3040156 RepID=A0AAV9G4C5_9PEZI|nr:hypothetical protein QBC34DRAFT_418077 [Podospora aff. communis PSN243]
MRLDYSFLFAICVGVARSADAPLCPWTPPTPCSLQEQPLRQEPPPPSKWEETGKCAGKWCIFVNRGFGNGEGTVAVTTKPNFELLSKIQDSAHQKPSSPPPYYIDQVPGKGLGVVANTTLRRGDPVMLEYPALLVHRELERSTTVPQHEQFDLLDLALDHLPPARRDQFLAQMGHFGGHRITDILTTNAFQLNLGGDDGHHYSSFPGVSRFNHDCRPNVAFYISNRLEHITTVVRDASPGEELSLTYLDSATPRAERRSRARNAWGFQCQCSQCALSDAASALSDARLVEIKQIEKLISDPVSEGVTPGLLRRLAKLYKDDRLEVELGSAYTLMALNYNMLGDAAAAVKYARLAEEAVTIEGGADVGDAKAMRELAAAPKEHFTWRRRFPG